MIPKMEQFRFWCQKVLPLVYDDSLSYYEILCKVVTYINNIINSEQAIIDDIDALRSELQVVENWISNFNTSYLEQIIRDAITTSIFVEIPFDHFVYYIPENWSDLNFKTTGYDTEIEDYDYGHLVLYY